MTSRDLGDVEGLYGESISVGITDDRIMLCDMEFTPLQAAQLALLLIRAYWLAREATGER